MERGFLCRMGSVMLMLSLLRRFVRGGVLGLGLLWRLGGRDEEADCSSERGWI